MVGIGASAGGIKALQNLFDALPADTGMAFTVIIHLDPNRESELAEVLQSHCKMPVTQVTDLVKIEPNHVYVIPPNKRLLARDSKFSLEEFSEPRGQRSPVDQFFRSLAKLDDEVIGILLSGSGTDGTVGMKAIKENGGFLMVQTPGEADFDSMPRSAIATGLVDLVLPVGEIAKQLVRLSQHEIPITDQPGDLSEDDAGELSRIFNHLRSRTGHDFSRYKRSTILRRIGRRMQVNHLSTFAQYQKFLRENVEEAQALFKDLLIGVTTFFRDPEAWEAFAEQVVPKLFEGKGPDDCIRAWVAGCSTGEEAYSLGILLLEHAAQLDSPPEIQIFASDLDEGALATAREGVYPDAIRSDVSQERLEQFFTLEGEHYRVKGELRDVVLFAAHSVLRGPPFSKLNLITCRNLLIYLERELQNQLFEIFHYGLLPGGYLFLGSSETVGSSDLFRTLDKNHRIHQAVNRSGAARHMPALPLSIHPHERLPQKRPPVPHEAASEARLHREMLEEHAPPSLLVDENHSVVHLSDSAGRYLSPSGGTVSRDINKLIRPELRFELQSALRLTLHENKATFTPPVRVQFNGRPVPVRMIVRPGRGKGGAEKLALVLFLETAPVEDEAQAATQGDDDSVAVHELREELHQTRQRLQATTEDYEATTEELKAANEELQSVNEEYRSTTEELETSKEELQSVNEELQTVNNELKSKLEEISQAHSDLHNLLIATDIATLFLDRQLRIKRFTPRLRTLFNIVPGDVGRPVSDLTHSLKDGDLIRDAKKVLTDLTPIEREVEGADKSCYLMRLRPYRTVEDKIEGVVVTFIDITERRKAEGELRQSEEHYRILLKSVREYAIFLMDPKRTIAAWNTGAQRIFGYSEEEVVGKSADLIFTEEDREAQAPEKEMEIAKKKGEAGDDRLHQRKDGERFWATGVLTALYDRKGKLRGFAKVLRDNTERKEAEEKLARLNESLEEKVRLRTQQLRSVASSLTLAEQDERHRISQILHDNLQQLLYGIQMKLDFARRDAESGKLEKLPDRISEAYTWLGDAIKTTRQLTVDLSPPVLKGEGLVDSLQWLVSHMDQMHNLKVEIEAPHSFPLPDEGMRVLLFHVVRELLFNVVKHGDSSRALVKLAETDHHVCIEVSDDGSGFDVQTAEKLSDRGFGLFHVRERLDLFGGRMEIESVPGQGTRVTIYAPFAKEKKRRNGGTPQNTKSKRRTSEHE